MERPDYVLEHCMLPAKLSGSKLDLEEVEIPLVGITGYGSRHERKGKQSTWVNGLIISPNFIHNNNCASQGYIEGIVTANGDMRLLESVFSFPAYEGDCFEYNLKYQEGDITNPKFEGEVFSRLERDGTKPLLQGRVKIIVSPFWKGYDSGQSRNHSLPAHNRHHIQGVYTPNFFKEFLGQIEEQGFEHPYVAVTDGLKKEREEKREPLDMRDEGEDLAISGDIPF